MHTRGIYNIFDLNFFHESNPSGPLDKQVLQYFLIRFKFRRNSQLKFLRNSDTIELKKKKKKSQKPRGVMHTAESKLKTLQVSGCC